MSTYQQSLDIAYPLISDALNVGGDYFASKYGTNGRMNKIQNNDFPIHNWYRFVLSFPPHLVKDYLDRFGLTEKSQVVLDPFCGTGTTLVEAKKLGIESVGIEAHPMPYFASTVKVDWSVNPNDLVTHSLEIAKVAEKEMDKNRMTLEPDKLKLLIKDSISPLPLHKSLVLINAIQQRPNNPYKKYELLALAKALVFSISNLHFGPEIGVKDIKEDADVITSWLTEIRAVADDLKLTENNDTKSTVFNVDSRNLLNVLKPQSIDAVITSPPYPNEKDYTRTTRLESVLLGLINSKQELRQVKKGLLRSNSRGVYKQDDDDKWIQNNKRVVALAEEIEKRRIELGKTSGFERMYHKVTKLYFGGMAKHFADMRTVLKPGALLAYVVGDQASYLRVMIRTGEILGEIAKSLGYEVIGLDLFRTRIATATKEQLREEVLLLRWSKKG